MFGLVDGNNFYASVERVFDPRLIGKPVVVLSNNDGCAIARSAEAKALGIKMGQPIHELRELVAREGVMVRSANFGLYGDISGRIVQILRELFPRVEVYSIDESFITFDGVPDPVATSLEARDRIAKWTGIPCCVGIGPTKTLAKAANKLAKGGPGVVSLACPVKRSKALERYEVEDVWGVGRRWAARLGSEGILTAADLLNADPDTLRSRYGVVLARTQRELQGIACQRLEEVEPERKQIVVSRSFGQEVDGIDELSEAVSTFAIRACEKLRDRQLKAGGVWVWLNTNPFRLGAAQYHPSRAMSLPVASADTRQVLAMVRALLRSMHRSGYRYKKGGVGLVDLRAGSSHQGDLFSGVDPRSAKLMEALDKANGRFGRGALGFASSGWRAKPTWGMRQASRSPAYTSRWDQLLRVH